MAEMNLAQVMKQRVKRHVVESQRERTRNPAIPNDVFDFSRSGLPADYEYHPVEVPNPASPLYSHQLGVMNNYLMAGFEFLTEDMVSTDGRNGTARIPGFVPIDGRATVAGCYILFANRDWYRGSRQRNVDERNRILQDQTRTREEGLQNLGGNKQLRRVESKREDITLDQLMKEEAEGSDRDED